MSNDNRLPDYVPEEHIHSSFLSLAEVREQEKVYNEMEEIRSADSDQPDIASMVFDAPPEKKSSFYSHKRNMIHVSKPPLGLIEFYKMKGLPLKELYEQYNAKGTYRKHNPRPDAPNDLSVRDTSDSGGHVS